MASKKGNKPKFKDKEGNIQLQIFKNKGKKNSVYAIYRIWSYRFPFKYNQKIDLTTPELESLKKLLGRLPEIKITKKGK